MNRFLPFVIACLYPFLFGIDLYAQDNTSVQIEATITDVRPHEEPRGFFIDPPDPVAFVQIAPTTLESPGTRIFNTDRSQRISLDDLRVGTRVSVTGTVSGSSLIATEIVVLQAVHHIWFDGVVIDIQRDGPHLGHISLLEFGERLDTRARVFIDGADMGTGLHSIIDLLNRTGEPVVATVSERNAFEQNWLFGRVDIKVGMAQPVRAEVNETITFQLPADPNEAVYMSEYENALREIPSTIPIDDRTIIRSEAQDGAEISFGDLPLYARVTVNATLSGSEIISADINVANIPREVRQTFGIDGIDAISRVVSLGTSHHQDMVDNATFFDRDGNPVTPREFDERQWGEPKAVALVTLDPISRLGTEARLITWQPNQSINDNQIIMGAIGDIHRGIWVDTHHLTIGTRNLSGILTPDTIIRLPDGTPIPRAQLDWGAQAEVGGFVARDEFVIREIVFQNVARSFELTTTLGEFKAEHQWMSFEPEAPFRAARNIQVTDHFGDPITLRLLADQLSQLDLQLRLSFTTDTDGSRLVSRIEAFRPDADITLEDGQERLQGAHIRAFDDPALIFPQGIEHANFNRDLEVYDTFGSRVDLRVLAPRIPVRVHGLIIQKQHNGQTERIARVHRIDIIGSERLTYRGTLLNVENNQLTFREPESFVISGHTDLREETGLQTDFVTLAGRIRSENGLRLHLGANFNTSGMPELHWARILRADESEPTFLSEHERVATFVSVDETQRSITPEPLPTIQITSETQIVNLSGDAQSQTDLMRDTRIAVQAEMQSGMLVAIEIRIETQPEMFSLTADIEHIDPENRVVQFASPDEILIAENARLQNAAGAEINLSELVSQLRNIEPRLLRVTYTPDSSQDTPVATQIDIVDAETNLTLNDQQVLVVVEDPGGQINIHDRRIHPQPLPSMVVAQDVAITDAAGQVITFENLSSRVRVHLTGHDTQGRLVVSSLQVLGPITETGEGTIASIDVANRTITPAPDPAQPINRRGSFTNPSGQRLTLTNFAEAVAQNPDLILVVYYDAFADGIQAMRLENRRNVSGQERGVELYQANEVVVDVANAQLTFVAFPPVRVAENAPITGPNGETWTLNDLEAGQRMFVRGYSHSEDNFVITSIFVRPQINTIHLRPEIIAADTDGIENDVRVVIVDQNDNPIDEALRLQVNYNGPEEIRPGHIVHNLPPGPHLLTVDLPERIGFADRVRVFISAQGTAFRVTNVSPEPNAINVPTITDISITFNEPLHQVGDYLAIEGTLLPEPINEGSDPELHNDGRTLILRNVQLVENTDYTMVLFSASSESGNSLGQTYRSRFSTSGQLTQPGGISGVITLSENLRFVGQALLFDANSNPVADVALSESGSFAFSDINAGTYRLYVNIDAEDGRSISTFLDANNNQEPDDIVLAQGEFKNDINLSLTLPDVTTPETTGSNANAIIALDLNRQEGNQNLTRAEEGANSDVHVAVYARDVVGLVGYEMTLNYDSEKLSFQGIERDNNNEQSILHQNGGLAVTLPPVVTSNRIKLAGGILGATDAQAVSGSGLLGILRFKVRNNNFTGTEVQVPRVVLQSQNATDILNTGISAEIVPAQSRLVMRLKMTQGEEPFNGYHTAVVQAEIVDALGATVTDGLPVHFEVIDGDGSFTESEVMTDNGTATSELKGTGAQRIAVSVGTVTEEVNIQLLPFDETDPTPQEVSAVVLDMNTSLGDQGQRSIASPNVGDTFTIDVVATRDALALAGYQIVLQYDATHFQFERFDVAGIFTGASPITIPTTGRISINVAFLGTGPTTESSGSIGQATFSVLDGFQAPSSIALNSAVFSTGTDQQSLEIGRGSGVAIGIAPNSNTPSSDFDGDGEVGFSDFIAFAQIFGTSSGDARYDARFDLDSSGDVGFPDFIAFAQAFGKPAGKVASKVVGYHNQNTQLQIQTTQTANEIELTVQLTDAGQVQGYGLQLTYDPSTLAFVGATNEHTSQFATDQNIALLAEHNTGTLHMSDVLQTSLTNNTNLAHVRFRVLDPTATSQVEITQALIADPAGQMTALNTQKTNVRAMPTGYALNQNHPNPFNPETVVPFSLPQTGEVHLAIYNTLGQEVRLLASGVKEAGFHRITWDGTNQNGQHVASGIYFVRLQAAGNHTSVRKMMLLK